MATYKSGNRIVGTSAERATFVPSSPHWVELGRTTLGATGDTIDVTGLTAKPYLMVLGHYLPSGNFRVTYRFNSDTGANYAHRKSANGGAENVKINRTSLESGNGALDHDAFHIKNIMNISSEEKLYVNHNVRTGGSGAANAPNRVEDVGKWANTSNSISSIQAINDQGGDFASGSEVVVLGYDPTDTSGTNFWEELASVELGSAGDTLDSGSFTAKKYLCVQWFLKDSGAHNGLMRFNSDSGSNYARRFSTNGGADSTGTSSTSINFATYGASVPSFSEAFIINKSDKEKLAIGSVVSQNTAGAGNAPSRREGVGKWANTSSQITSIQIVNTDSGDFAAGSIIKVWGAD